MSNVETFSTIVKDGEDLTKINAWLNRFRCGELVRFMAQRVTIDSVKIVLEAQDIKRLRIVSTWPPHQAYLQSGKTVPYVDVHFSEPIALETFQSGQTTINGAIVPDHLLTTLDDGSTLRIDTSGTIMTAAGQYEIIFGTDVRHYNKLWKLYGERKIIWFTSEHGGSRGGEDICDPRKNVLQMAKISIEGQHDEQKMIREFYNAYRVDPEDVEAMILTSGFPEHDRTTIWVIYCVGRIPYVKCVNPEFKACFFQDGSPDEVTVEIGLTEPLLEESLIGEIEVDGAMVTPDKWDLSQGGYLLTVRFTPAQYKHHMVKIVTMQSGEFTRSWPYMHSFVIHDHASPFRFVDTVEIDDTDSPYTLTSNDVGKFYRVDTTNGSVIVTLPESTDIASGDLFGFIKTAEANSLFIVRSGTDTINGGINKIHTKVWSSTVIQSNGVDAWSVVSSPQALPAAPPRTTTVRMDTAGDLILEEPNKTLCSFTASSNEPPAVDAAVYSTRNNHGYLGFNDTTQQAAIFSDVMPRLYGVSSGPGITVILHWTAVATSGDVAWVINLERNEAGGTDIDSDSWGADNNISATTVPGTSGQIATSSVNISDGTNMDSVKGGELFRIRVRRDPANDSATGDAQLLAVEIKMQ